VAYNKSTLWDAKVRTDAMILDSWFGTLKAQGAKIYDVEIEKSILEAIDIRDLVEPPELCIFVMGTKRLPNKEAPNSILEAIGYRRHVGKPTWVVDQPDHPLDQMHHLFYSETLESWLHKWPHIFLHPTDIQVEGEARIRHEVASVSLDELLDQADEETPAPKPRRPSRRVEIEEEEVFEEDEGAGTRNLLSTLKVESEPKKKGFKSKKTWSRNR
jgi:hypothetical protein